MFANANPLGLLAASRAQNVVHVIGRTEELVTALSMTEADIRPAADALSAAKVFYAAQDYSEAVAQAKRAGALAVSLNERFNAYMATWKALQACRDELQRLGLPTQDLDAVLGAAEKEVARQVEEDGAVVPNYLGAKAMLERATGAARALVGQARQASREILLASLAIEALSEPPTTNTTSWLAVRIEEMVEQATRELALGNVRVAHTLASEARLWAESARVDAVRVQNLLDETEMVTGRLKAEGVVAHALEQRIGSARDALVKGFLDPTTAMAVVRRLSREAASLANRYSRARSVLEHAERVYARLQREGFSSHAVEAALLGARRSLGAGDWAGVRENVRRATEAFVRRRKEQDVLSRGITEIHERAVGLEELQLRLLPEVHDLLGRAKEEFQSGRFSSASENLLLANGLMTQATGSGS